MDYKATQKRKLLKFYEAAQRLTIDRKCFRFLQRCVGMNARLVNFKIMQHFSPAVFTS